MNLIIPRDDLVNPATTSSKTRTATGTRRQTTNASVAATRTGTASRTGTAVHPSAFTTRASSGSVRNPSTAASPHSYTVLTTTMSVVNHSGGTTSRSGVHSTLQAGISQPVKAKPHPHTSKAAIVGAVCGGLAVIVLLGVVIYFIWRKKRATIKMIGREEKGIAIQPYIIDHASPQPSGQKHPLPLPSRPISSSQIEPVNVGPMTAFSPGVPRSPPPDYLFHTMDMRQQPQSLYPSSIPDSNHHSHHQFDNGPMGHSESQDTPEGSDIHILGGKSPIGRYERHGIVEQYRW